MQVSLHSYSTSTSYHPTIKIVGFLARKFYKHGHLVGNVVLKEFIDLLRTYLLNKIDANQFEIYRFGGEEFCLFFYDSSEKEVFSWLDEFSFLLKNQGIIVEEDVRIDLTFSAGISSNDDYEKDLLTTIERADTACYYSKEFGRNQITLYEKLDNQTRKNQQLEGNVWVLVFTL